jgi:aspartyl-tRNA(Asn)/glutamyl-tRNA(Gln) amidotransferase subunit B
MSTTYELVIGIECHVQLKTRTKLFCGCDNDAREAAPNTKVCPVCMGFPGALPVLNEQAIYLALRAGLALGAEASLVKRTKFDRKNYFYPDLPSGYQITQFDEPIVGLGRVEVPLDGGSFTVGITRAHLEADAGKLTHPEGANYSLVDYNRASTPLLEIVSEPDMHSAAQAKAYATELYNLMRYAGVSDANLYYGNMRFDVNVSIRPTGTTPMGTRSETKNLNSFRAIEKAVEYEYARQKEVLEGGGKVVQETRGWDDSKQITYSMRSKEDAHDYRYFPEPDLPPVMITENMVEAAKGHMPAMPSELRMELSTAGLGSNETEILISMELASICLDAAKRTSKGAVKRIAGWFTGDVQKYLSDNNLERAALRFNADTVAGLSGLVDEGKLSSTAARQVLMVMMRDGGQPLDIATHQNLIQQSDSGAITAIVDQVIADNPGPASEYRAGKQQVLGFLVGQVMKASRGQANPAMAGEALRSKLTE